MPQQLVIGWDEYFKLIDELARRIRDSPFRPDQVVAITTGGAIPGIALAKLFNVFPAFIAVQSYHALGRGMPSDQRGRIHISREMASTLSGIGDNILLVDDLDDSGATLEETVRWLQARYPQVRRIATAVLWHKSTSQHHPDFSAVTIGPGEDGKCPWIVQPIERYETMALEDL